jgi:hypothetical protein
LTAGCTRTVEDCRKFSQAVDNTGGHVAPIANFRGEPYVPGLESANRFPTTG